jgi:hypothetical protein
MEEGGASGWRATKHKFLLFDKAQSQNNLVSDFLLLPYLRLPSSYCTAPTRINIVLDQVVDPVSDRSEAADVFRPPRAPSTLFERQDTYTQTTLLPATLIRVNSLLQPTPELNHHFPRLRGYFFLIRPDRFGRLLPLTSATPWPSTARATR